MSSSLADRLVCVSTGSVKVTAPSQHGRPPAAWGPPLQGPGQGRLQGAWGSACRPAQLLGGGAQRRGAFHYLTFKNATET